MTNTLTANDKKLIKFFQYIHDLEQAHSALIFLSDIDADQYQDKPYRRRFMCYDTAFVDCYARPFLRQRGDGFPQLSAKAVALELSDDERVLHDKIIKGRHKRVAHGDIEATALKVSGVLVQRNGEKYHLPIPTYDEPLLTHVWGLEDITKLTRKWLRAVANWASERMQIDGGIDVLVSPKVDIR